MASPQELLRQLFASQGLTPSQNLDKIVETLHEPLKNYAEVEFRSDARRIDLITLTQKSEEAEAFLSLLRRLGANEEKAANASKLLRLGSGQTLGMKLPITGDSAGGELYLRGAIPLADVFAFIRDNLGLVANLDEVEKVAAHFGKSYTHMLATDVSADSVFTLFFTSYLKEDEVDQDCERLMKTIEILGIPGGEVSRFCDSHRILSAIRPGTVYISLQIVNGQLQKAVKIDYSAVELTSLAEVMSFHGLSSASQILLDTWGAILGVRRAGYAGVLMGEGGVTAVRAYFSVDRSLLA